MSQKKDNNIFQVFYKESGKLSSEVNNWSNVSLIALSPESTLLICQQVL
ncbi:hypothetical protein [Iningainema tapete]|nr:hypothetical protein [Iningainema tapete]